MTKYQITDFYTGKRATETKVYNSEKEAWEAWERISSYNDRHTSRVYNRLVLVDEIKGEN